MSRCQAHTRKGTLCRNNAMHGASFCYLTSHGASGAPVLKRVLNAIANHKLLLAIVGVVGSLASILSIKWYYADRAQAVFSGVLDARPIATRPYLSVGTTRFIVEEPNGVFLRDGGQPLLRFRLSEGALFVTTTIYDADGKLVAELHDNEWALNKNALYERNYTPNVVECKDNRGRVVLQVVHLGDTVHLAGTFRCRSGWTVVLGPIGMEGAVFDLRPPGVPNEYELPALCRYPSAAHLGECPGVPTLSASVRHGPGPAYLLKGSLDICTGPRAPKPAG
jgi:hypothetical protein